MRSHSDTGIEKEGHPLPLSSGSAESTEEDRSLGAVMREIARSLAGWPFFVVAVQLLLYGARLI